METALPVLQPLPRAQTCVWMDAGAVAFRLCDRGFACDGCPFDACMRGDIDAERAMLRHHEALTPWAFPSDRLYTAGHLWVQVIRDGRVRTGLDACASRLLAGLRELRPSDGQHRLEPGDPLCLARLEGGDVTIGSPVAGRVLAWNDLLSADPSVVVAAPYGRGWLAEMSVTGLGQLDAHRTAAEAEARAEADLGHVRRQIAFALLAARDAHHPHGPGLDRAFLDAAATLVGPEPLAALARRLLLGKG